MPSHYTFGNKKQIKQWAKKQKVKDKLVKQLSDDSLSLEDHSKVLIELSGLKQFGKKPKPGLGTYLYVE